MKNKSPISFLLSRGFDEDYLLRLSDGEVRRLAERVAFSCVVGEL
jgi:hypothetical protein